MDREKDARVNMFEWDVFISHASEDDKVAMDLTNELTRFGLRVWVDGTNLRLGDSIRAGIDHGLGKSAYGVLLITKDFLRKRWPAQEVGALFALEFDGRPRILPVWHGVNTADVAAFSPLLSDRLPARMSDGLVNVARSIALRVLDSTTDAPAVNIPTVATRLRTLLEQNPTPDVVSGFLDAHRWVIPGALQVSYGDLHAGDVVVGAEWKPPFVHETIQPTTGQTYLTLVGFGAVDDDPATPSRATTEVREKITDTLHYLAGPGAARYRSEGVFSLLGPSGNPVNWRVSRVDAVIFRGRRAVVAERPHNYWSAKHLRVEERSYDALIDSAGRELRPWQVHGLAPLGEIQPEVQSDE